ncbi:MAG: ABC transporter permease [Saprospiraceae bacterium]|nr:ABC transporter permease [Saprospiraceae bacterium]
MEIDLASREAVMGKLIGRFIPMILVFFIFTGIIYIAIDITAGEKERKTLQTLFVAPVKVSEIIAGKFLAVFTVGIATALMNLLSLVVAFLIQIRLLGGDIAKIGFSISSTGWVWLIVLIVLSTVFIGAITLAVVLLANSYKESQSYVTPLMLVILLPAIYAFTPGIELTFVTALIPMVNIFLAMGAIFIGNTNFVLMALVSVMALLYAVLSLGFASLIFRNENVITGEKVNFKQLFKQN